LIKTIDQNIKSINAKVSISNLKKLMVVLKKLMCFSKLGGHVVQTKINIIYMLKKFFLNLIEKNQIIVNM